MKNIAILLSMLMASCSSCKKFSLVERFYDIIVTNNSPIPIRVYLADELAYKQYPDTTLPDSKPALRKIDPGETISFDSRTPWEENLEKLPSDTLSVFIFDNNVYENESWDSIRIYYKVLKRFDLDINNLKAQDYKISYP